MSEVFSFNTLASFIPLSAGTDPSLMLVEGGGLAGLKCP